MFYYQVLCIAALIQGLKQMLVVDELIKNDFVNSKINCCYMH